MDPAQFQTFLKANAEATDKAIEKYVNGYMREMRQILTDHIQRVEPMIKNYELQRDFNIGAKRYGDKIIYWGKFVVGLGILYGAIKLGILQLFIPKQ